MSIRRVVLCGALAVCANARAESAFDLAPGQKVLPAVQYKSLAVFPIVLDGNSESGQKFMTLTDGLKAKRITVSEDKNGGSVNQVIVANNGDAPLLLLAGEIILGGQQDRILGKDTVVPPHQTLPLQVFCVEHGRWSGKREFAASGGMVESKARMRAKFEDNQQRVWDEVAKKTSSLKAQTSTGTYRSLATGEAGEAAVKPYRDNVTKKLEALPQAKKMIGYVAAVNGRVSSVEKFAEPTLFAQYRDRLLDALYVSVADVKQADKVTLPEKKDVDAFMQRAEAAPAEQVLDNPAATTVENKGAVKKSKLIIKASPAKPLYESYQAE
jgi:hypothetical protein